jgi:hypothetical protein
MTQSLSVLTGCTAGATVRSSNDPVYPCLTSSLQESFVVVPFELVKIKYISSKRRVIIGYS